MVPARARTYCYMMTALGPSTEPLGGARRCERELGEAVELDAMDLPSQKPEPLAHSPPLFKDTIYVPL